MNLLIIAFLLISQVAYAVTLDEKQQQALEKTGKYYYDVSNKNFTINTYETVCKGYYTREETEGRVIYTGYGDLAKEYTYEITKPIVSRISTTTVKQ